MTSRAQVVIGLVLIAVVVQGFRLVTQSGLTGFAGSVQNDGYASVGGSMILLGGVGTGYLLTKIGRGKK